MKKQLSKSLLGLALCSALSGFAQQPVLPCATDDAMEREFLRTPGMREAHEKAQREFKYMIDHPVYQERAAAAQQFTIPVVFHVLHTGGTENIPDATIYAAIDWINKDLAKLHSDANTVTEPFKSMFIPSDIKLMLAKKDAQGNCITGIIHKYDTRTMWDRDSPNFPASYYSGITTPSLYPTGKYLNVIIVKQIDEPTSSGITVGYTYLPSTNWGTNGEQDCIVYRYDFLAGGQARSLTHELGHWLNLNHVFGQTNNPGTTCGDDDVCDTPPMKGAINIGSCPSSTAGNVCATTATCGWTAGMQNTENIMNYSNCPKNFTAGQTARMRATLGENNPPNPFFQKRVDLVSSANLIARDVDGNSTCKPVAEFLSSTNLYTVCSGNALLMKDFSYNAPITSYSWTADNSAIIANPTSSNTSITFPNVGVVNVALTVSNAQGSSTQNRTVLVLNGAPGMVAPAMEGFEAATIPANWTIVNGNPGSPTFERTTDAVPYEGTACLVMKTANSAAYQEDYVQTPIIDMSAGSGQFQFAYAYARQSTSHVDHLKIDVSSDCGGSYNTILDLVSSQMMQNSGDQQSIEWYPSASFEWKVVDLSTYPGAAAKWVPYKNSPNVIVRFRFAQGPVGNGNNFFLDAINLPGSTVGMNEFRKETRMKLYPNPTSGSTNVEFKLSDPSVVKVSVLDILGKEVQSVPAANLNPGSHTIIINKDQALPAGVYNVNVSINGVNLASKLILE